MSAPAKREDDARQRALAAIERRLKKKNVPYFNQEPPKKPYPNMKTRASR